MNFEIIKEKLTDQFGFRFSVNRKLSPDGYTLIIIRPYDIEFAKGFIIQVEIRWRMITAEFVPESYAASLIEEMGKANASKKATFLSFAESSKNFGNRLKLMINNIPLEPENLETITGRWTDFRFKLEKLGVDAEKNDLTEVNTVIDQLLTHAVGLAISLLPIEEVFICEDFSLEGLPEGSRMRIEVNRYERSKLNREACIAHHGAVCHACGVDFLQKYGEIGEGFIHVHHIIPVSSLGEDYIVEPQKDLIPVCPNCHAMIHRKNPPLNIEDLKKFLKEH